MNLDEFQVRAAALRADLKYPADPFRLAKKWEEEQGEFADAYTDAYTYGGLREVVIEESGDSLVVMAAMLAERGITLQAAADFALAKLEKRRHEVKA